MKNFIEGIVPPMLTPFDRNGRIDEDELRKFTDFLIERGVHGLFPCGTIGEFSNLSTEEIREVERIVVDETEGRVPVLAGAGASGTEVTLERITNAEEVGADGIICVTPFYLNCDQEGIIEHFDKVSNRTDLPVLIYHIPQCTGQDLDVETVSVLEKKHENIVGIKDSSGDLNNVGEIIRETTDDFLYLQGWPRLFLPSLVLGADGCVPGNANIKPKFVLDLYEAFKNGNMEEAKNIQLNQVDVLSNACSIGPFPSGFKNAASLVGHDPGPTRSPIRSLTDEEVDRQVQILESLGLLDSVR